MALCLRDGLLVSKVAAVDDSLRVNALRRAWKSTAMGSSSLEGQDSPLASAGEKGTLLKLLALCITCGLRGVVLKLFA